LVFQKKLFLEKMFSKFARQESEKHCVECVHGDINVLRRATVELASLYRKVGGRKFLYSNRQNPRRALTKDAKGVSNFNWDNASADLILYVNDVIVDEEFRVRYRIVDLLGQGTFGQVVKCALLRDDDDDEEEEEEEEKDNDNDNDDDDAAADTLESREKEEKNDSRKGKRRRAPRFVAVKVVKNKQAYYNQGLTEVDILRRMNKVDTSGKIVKLQRSFVYRRHLCLVFEQLGINLYELIKSNQHRGLSINLVRHFTKQLLEAIKVTYQNKLIHCDMKVCLLCARNFALPDSTNHTRARLFLTCRSLRIYCWCIRIRRSSSSLILARLAGRRTRCTRTFKVDSIDRPR
jgi:dual specificity protein kinase YAK1